MFVIVQNDPDCPAGSILEILARTGHPSRTVAAYLGEAFPDQEELTGVVVLGGEMGVHETLSYPYLDRVKQFIREVLRSETPLLGICLGGQLLADVAGGRVSSPSPHGETGIGRVSLTPAGEADPLFAGVPNPFVTFQLHNDSFTIPAKATLLAGSERCPAQAFRLGNCAYGLQFHPEADRAIVDCWEKSLTPRIGLLSGFDASLDPFQSASRAILGNFICRAAALRSP